MLQRNWVGINQKEKRKARPLLNHRTTLNFLTWLNWPSYIFYLHKRLWANFKIPYKDICEITSHDGARVKWYSTAGRVFNSPGANSGSNHGNHMILEHCQEWFLNAKLRVSIVHPRILLQDKTIKKPHSNQI